MKGILCSESTRFEVVVCDDASSDDCEERLTKIHDERFRYFRNAKNLGAHKNWERALELGSGEYLFLVMGRDRIRGEHISRLIEILEYARDNNITYLYDGYSKGRDIQVFDGIEAMIRFLGYYHPTASIFNAKLFREIPSRTRYFEISDMYPENYVRRDMLLKGKGASIMSGVFHYPDKLIDSTKIQSTVMSGGSVYDMFYAPKRRTKLILEILDMVDADLPGRFSESDINRFFEVNYQILIYAVSFGFRGWCGSYESQAHYGQKVRHVSRFEMLRNVFTAYRTTLKHIRANGTCTKAKHRIMKRRTARMTAHLILHYPKQAVRFILEPLGVWGILKRIKNRIKGTKDE